MRSDKPANAVWVSACAIVLGAASPVRAYEAPRLPAPGASYADVRRDLLRQGMSVPHNVLFRFKSHVRDDGLTCESGPRAPCEALFLYRRPDGWGDYVVMSVNPTDGRIEDAHFARFEDHLLPVPPPESPDVPKLKDHTSRRASTCGRWAIDQCRMQVESPLPFVQTSNVKFRCTCRKLNARWTYPSAMPFGEAPMGAS
jgi:hypothetical protein